MQLTYDLLDKDRVLNGARLAGTSRINRLHSDQDFGLWCQACDCVSSFLSQFLIGKYPFIRCGNRQQFSCYTV